MSNLNTPTDLFLRLVITKVQPSAFKLLSYICNQYDGSMSPVQESLSSLAKNANSSRPTLTKAIKELEDAGYLNVDRTSHINSYVPLFKGSGRV